MKVRFRKSVFVDLADLKHVVGADDDARVFALAAVEVHDRHHDAGPVAGEALVLGHDDYPATAVWRRKALAKSTSFVVGLPSSFHVCSA